MSSWNGGNIACDCEWQQIQDRFIFFVIAIVFISLFIRSLSLTVTFSLSLPESVCISYCLAVFSHDGVWHRISRSTYCYARKRSTFFNLLLSLSPLFILLHLFTFWIVFDFSKEKSVYTHTYLLNVSRYNFPVPLCAHFVMRNVSDLEMPSISVNWAFIHNSTSTLRIRIIAYVHEENVFEIRSNTKNERIMYIVKSNFIECKEGYFHSLKCVLYNFVWTEEINNLLEIKFYNREAFIN